MGYGNCVLVNDTPSNLEVVADAGFGYRGADGDLDLQRQMQHLLDSPELVAQYRVRAHERARTCYRWEEVVKQHANVYQQLLGGTSAAGAAEFVQTQGS